MRCAPRVPNGPAPLGLCARQPLATIGRALVMGLQTEDAVLASASAEVRRGGRWDCYRVEPYSWGGLQGIIVN